MAGLHKLKGLFEGRGWNLVVIVKVSEGASGCIMLMRVLASIKVQVCVCTVCVIAKWEEKKLPQK